MSALGRLPFGVVLGILAVATLGGVFALDRLGFGVYSLAAIAVTGGLAVAYLWEYSRRLEIDAPPSADPEDEPFDDPVEAATRLASGGIGSAPMGTEPSPDAPAPVSAVATSDDRDDGLE